MKSFILILQFLTTLPIKIQVQAGQEDFEKGIVYFPIVGAVLGGILCMAYWLLGKLMPASIGMFLLVVLEVLLTGGLHMDGLADSFDGLYSYRDKARMLEIMRDSRIGTNGVLAIVSVMVLKIALLIACDSRGIYGVLFVMPLMSRYMLVWLARFSVYARKEGMGGFFIGKTTNRQLFLATLFLLPIFFIQTSFLYLSLLLLVCTFFFKDHVYKKIDGITGDILGAWVEMSEVLYLFLFLVLKKVGL